MENHNQTVTPGVVDNMPTATTKQRHGCLTAWLIFMIVSNSIFSLVYLFGSAYIRKSYPNAPEWAMGVLTLSCIFNLVCSIALYKWKKWGFWGFVVTTAIGLWMNSMFGMTIVQKILGLSGVFLLYGVLRIGKENKGWPQLE